MEIFNAVAQRAALVKLAKALGSRDSALRRDSCGDPAIFGSRGHIYACPGGTLAKPDPSRPAFQIVVTGWEGLGWGNARRAMEPFARVTQDGDGEGILIMARLPTAAEAKIIRHYVGVEKKRQLGEEALIALRQRGAANRFVRVADAA